MRWFAAFCVLCALFQAPSPKAGTASAGLTLGSLRQQLRSFVEDPRFARSQWGIEIISLETGKEVFAHNNRKLLKPASNTKLFTGAFALDTLGTDFRIRTSIYSSGTVDKDGTLTGDLVIYGRGDPTVTSRYPGRGTNAIEGLVQALAGARVRRIRGDVIGDDTFFAGPPYGTSWNWDDLLTEDGAAVSALTYENNAVDIRVTPGSNNGAPVALQLRPETSYIEIINRALTGASGSRQTISLYQRLAQNRAVLTGQLPADSKGWSSIVMIDNPALWFASEFRKACLAKGIEVTGQLRSRSWPEPPTNIQTLKQVGFQDSPSAVEMVKQMMKESENLAAQLLFLQAGAKAAGSARSSDSEASARAALATFLRRTGVAANEVFLDEGAGLSRSALVTPHAIIELLKSAQTNSWAKAFKASLPIAGIDGTLKARLAEDEVRSRVAAKTGTLRFVGALSGFLKTRAGEELAFAVMLNAYSHPQHSPREEIDNLVRLIARLTEKTSAAPQ